MSPYPGPVCRVCKQFVATKELSTVYVGDGVIYHGKCYEQKQYMDRLLRDISVPFSAFARRVDE